MVSCCGPEKESSSMSDMTSENLSATVSNMPIDLL